MAFTPGARSAYGVGKESVAGTAVSASRFPPLSKFDASEKIDPLIDDGYRGSMAAEYGNIQGPRVAEVSFSGPSFYDTLGDWLYNILGDYAVGAPVSSVYPHTFGLLNSGTGQPPTHTLLDSSQLPASVGVRVYPYACLSELTIAGNATGLCTIDAKATSNPSAVGGASMTNTPTTEVAQPAWISTVSVAGAGAANVSEWAVTISRELMVAHTADGTQAPYVIGRGPVTVSGKLSFIALDETPLITGLITNQQPALVITVNNGLATTALREIAITMTKSAYQTADMQRNTLLGWDVPFKAIANSTDAAASGGLSPIKAVLKNALTTY